MSNPVDSGRSAARTSIAAINTDVGVNSDPLAARRVAERAATVGPLVDAIDAAVGPLLEPGAPCALVDFPNYANVGDSAIWLGTTEWFRRRGVTPAYACDTNTYDAGALAARIGGGTIFLQGGGNFGDVWPQHQRLRERVARDFPANPIVQLPQTIQFGDPIRGVADATRALAAHRNLTLLCRDRKSLEFAAEHLPAARRAMCPDMAFALGPIARADAPCTDVVWLARTDSEVCKDMAEADLADLDVERIDWLEEPITPLRLRNSELGMRLKTGASADRDVLDELMETYDPLAWDRLRRGCGLLSRGRVVVTDRLHAHILCVLLGIPHVVLDNSYGKIARFREAFTADCGLVRAASTTSSAFDIARSMLTETPELAPGAGRRRSAVYNWAAESAVAARDLAEATEPDAALLVVDDDVWRAGWLGPGALCGRQLFSLLERDGEYWGIPSTDAEAIGRVDELRRAGARYIAFGAPGLWWMDCFAGLTRRLRDRFHCVLENERLVVFDLRVAGVRNAT